MGSPRFMRPKPRGHGDGGGVERCPNLYVANCGPAVGLSFDAIARAFSEFGLVTGVYAADESGTRVIVSFSDEDCAEAAFTAFNGRPCSLLAGRFLHIRYSVPRPSPLVLSTSSITTVQEHPEETGLDSVLEQHIDLIKEPGSYNKNLGLIEVLSTSSITTIQEHPEETGLDSVLEQHIDLIKEPGSYNKNLGLIEVQGHDSVEVCLTAKELNIPGLYLFHDFIAPKEEEELLAAVDSRSWISLAKRRVQHYGYEFCYQTRNVDTTKRLGELPSFVSPVLERISACTDLNCAATIDLDQLTVNEYPPGVGLSPHIDTHSAFEDGIFSLSLAGPCIMEFRRYLEDSWQSDSVMIKDMNEEDPETSINFLRRAVYLPPRSLLLLSGEARYAWLHYIPHHKVDNVKDSVIRRSSRRVSFTFRKVRRGPCCCTYIQYCDSQR